MNSLFAFVSHKHSAESVSSLLAQGIAYNANKGEQVQEVCSYTYNTACMGIAMGTRDNAAACVAQNDNIVVCFSGRILNTSPITNVLKQDYSDNPAQNVLLLYEQMANEAFALLQGYWSLVIWNKQSHTLTAAHDHFSHTPLYYFHHNGVMAVASHPFALYKVFEQAQGLDDNAINDYLCWGNISTHSQQFFAHIFALPQAGYVQYEAEKHSLKLLTYYTLPYKACTAAYNEYEEPYFADKLRGQLIDSIKAAFQNNASMAIGLSGGLDSATIACVAHQFCPHTRLTAFTLVNNVDGGEAPWAKKIADYTGSEWVQVPCSAYDIQEYTPQVIQAQGIPLFSMSTVAQYLIMKNVHEHGFTHVVDGQGADEMLGGYNVFFLPFLHFLRSQWLVKDYIAELVHLGNASLSIRDVAIQKLKQKAKQYYYYPSRLMQKTNALALSALPQGAYEPNACCCGGSKLVLNEYLYEYYTRYLPHILRWGESSAAAFGMDCIMPFASSTALAENVFHIPSTQKIHHGWTKYMLRKAMTGIVPDEVLWRKEKMGFYIPEQAWYTNMGPVMKEVITQYSGDEYIRPSALLTSWSSEYASNIHFRRFVFRAYCYIMWRQML